MRKPLTILSCALAVLLATGGEVCAQYQILRSTIGNGGRVLDDGVHRVSGTVGQPLIGVIQSANELIHSGFWASLLTPEVEVSTPDVQAFYNASLQVPIEVGNTSVGFIVAAEVFLCFDGDLLSVDGFSTDGTLLSSSWSVVSNVVEGTSSSIDTLKMAMASAGTALSGAGALLFIDFTVADVREAAASPLSLAHVLFNDGVPKAMTSDGSFTLLGSDGALAVAPPQVTPGVDVTLSVADPDEDRDANAVDTLSVAVINGAQSEVVALYETGVSTGVFVGAASTVFSTGATTGDGIVQAQAGDSLVFSYVDQLTSVGGDSLYAASVLVVGGSAGTLAVSVVTQPGDGLRVRVDDADANTSSTDIDTVQVVIYNGSDIETLSLAEIAIDASAFFGALATTDQPSAPGDGTLHTAKGDLVSIHYADLNAQGETVDVQQIHTVVDPFGDVDGNGPVQAFDAALVLRSLIGVPLQGFALLAADVADPFASITPFDVSLLLQRVVGSIGEFPVQGTASLNHPQSAPPAPKPILVERYVELRIYPDYVSVWLDERGGVVAGDLRLRGISGKVRMSDELGDFIWAEQKLDDGIRVVFAGPSSMSGPGEILRAYGTARGEVSVVGASFNDGRVAVRLGDVRRIPTAYALLPNAPNPFNPQTAIRFELPRASAVALEIFDALGQKVRTLIDGEMSVGLHQVVWDGRSAAGFPVGSGLYFYQLRAGDFKEVKRMLLLK